MKFVTVEEMISIEREADSSGLSYDKMMENAGRGLAEVILRRYGNLKRKNILALVGSGNNGGDALVALTYLVESGWNAKAYVVRPRKDDDPLITRFQERGGFIFQILRP